MTIKNCDMPASSTGTIRNPDIESPDSWLDSHGLTKREHFAGLAVAASVHDYQGFDNSMDSSDWESIAVNAVGIADALLRALGDS